MASVTEHSLPVDAVPVLLLKTKSTPSESYQELFSETRNGDQFFPVFVPVLQHRHDEEGMEKVRQLLRERRIRPDSETSFGGLIFTSPRAVEAFAKLVDEGDQ